MRTFMIFAILAFFAVSVRAMKENNDDYDYEDDLTVGGEHAIEVPDYMSVEEACQPALCARAYEPLCLTINDLLYTANSVCELDGHLRCLLAKSRQTQTEFPKVQFLYAGECTAEISPNF